SSTILPNISDGSAASVQTVTAVPHSVGTLGRIVEVDQRDDGTIHLVVLGDARFRIEEVVQPGPYLVARVTYLDDRPGTDAATLGELSAAARTLGQRYLRLLAAALSRDDDDGSQLLERVWKRAPTDPSAFSFFLGALIQTVHSDRQRLLRTETTADRLQDAVTLLRRENEILRTSLRYREDPSKPRLN
ncbi:MAG: LON peptidase substrate-binding domain-containing protein, partial [Chloroflexota bacterium]|nr:LON peptidase substrate-binding domain-containing protein [Chloroflexota bacterium]